MLYKDYNKTDIFNTLDKIEITKNGNNQVITRFNERIINVTNVSDRYEIFDIVPYLKDKIELIEKNFAISKYSLRISKGQQELRLLSDSINVGDVSFYKSFFILNSTDKSRRLSFHTGLYSDIKNIYIIGARNIGLCKLHLKGVTEAAEQVISDINDETFSEQIEALNSLVGHQVHFSKIREIVLGEDKDIPKINHKKFDVFKNLIRVNKQIHLTEDEKKQLWITSEDLKITHDFYLDAFLTFQIYMSIFNKMDSQVIKKETNRIMQITRCAVRNSILNSLGI